MQQQKLMFKADLLKIMNEDINCIYVFGTMYNVKLMVIKWISWLLNIQYC